MSVNTPSRSTPQVSGGDGAERLLRPAAWVAGIAAVAMAVYQIATPGAPSATFESWSDYLRELLTLAYLGGSIAALVGLRRAGIAPPLAARLIATGYGLIGVGVAIGLILRDDPDWFFFLAGPGLLLSAIGFVVLAVSAGRRGAVPAWVAVLAGIGGFVALALAELGTSVLIGAFWIYIASRSSARTIGGG